MYICITYTSLSLSIYIYIYINYHHNYYYHNYYIYHGRNRRTNGATNDNHNQDNANHHNDNPDAHHEAHIHPDNGNNQEDNHPNGDNQPDEVNNRNDNWNVNRPNTFYYNYYSNVRINFFHHFINTYTRTHHEVNDSHDDEALFWRYANSADPEEDPVNANNINEAQRVPSTPVEATNLFNLNPNTLNNEFGELSAGEHYMLHGHGRIPTTPEEDPVNANNDGNVRDNDSNVGNDRRVARRLETDA